MRHCSHRPDLRDGSCENYSIRCRSDQTTYCIYPVLVTLGMSLEEPLTRGEFIEFMERHATALNEAFDYIFKRFDDIEKRIDRLETDLHYVKNDTRLIHPMFELVRTDGTEVGELKVRVERLEKRPDGN